MLLWKYILKNISLCLETNLSRAYNPSVHMLQTATELSRTPLKLQVGPSFTLSVKFQGQPLLNWGGTVRGEGGERRAQIVLLVLRWNFKHNSEITYSHIYRLRKHWKGSSIQINQELTLETSDKGTVQQIVQLSATAILANIRLLTLRLTEGLRMNASKINTWHITPTARIRMKYTM